MTSVAATLRLLDLNEGIREWANPCLCPDEMLLGLVLAKPGFSSCVWPQQAQSWRALAHPCR